MKSHPVPQNIMDVEFKLFGELTIRQFGYVAGGALAAFVCYVLFADIGLVRWPLVVFFGILGIMLAVFKVNDRPFEIWLANFIFAIFTSQRSIWKKSAKTPEILRSINVNSSSKGSINTVINRSPLSSVYLPNEEIEENISKEDKEEADRLSQIDSLWGTDTTQKVQSPIPQINTNVTKVEVKPIENVQTYSKPAITVPQVQEVKTIPDETLKKEVKQIARLDLDDILPDKVSREDMLEKMDENTGVDQPLIPTEETVVNDKVASVVEDKMSSETSLKNTEYLDTLKTQLEEQNKIINSLRTKASESKVVMGTKNVVIETQKSMNDKTSLDKANFVSGYVKEKSGKGLSNVTLIIKDSKFRPVRATRTNNLGAFNITTPLPNGDYSLEAVRSGMNFDNIDFSLDGSESKVFELVCI